MHFEPLRSERSIFVLIGRIAVQLVNEFGENVAGPPRQRITANRLNCRKPAKEAEKTKTFFGARAGFHPVVQM
jgi:hypothetical protein